jgi:hypothetical protein
MKTPTPVSNNQPCAGKTPGRKRGWPMGFRLEGKGMGRKIFGWGKG